MHQHATYLGQRSRSSKDRQTHTRNGTTALLRKQEAFEKSWAHSPLRAAARRITIHQVSLLSRRTPPAHRCLQRQRRRRQRQRVTEGTAMAPWNGPNKSRDQTSTTEMCCECQCLKAVLTVMINGCLTDISSSRPTAGTMELWQLLYRTQSLRCSGAAVVAPCKPLQKTA